MVGSIKPCHTESEGIVDAETITLDLIKFQGGAQFNVLESETITSGSYNQVIINVPGQDHYKLNFYAM